MTQEEKDLLLKDLCGRLPYNVKIHVKYTDIGETIELDSIVEMIDNEGIVGIEVINNFGSAWTCVQIDNVKPYLFPLSSMSEEQEIEFLNTCVSQNPLCWTLDTFNWLNKNHFDYNYLIDDDLAIDAIGLDIY